MCFYFTYNLSIYANQPIKMGAELSEFELDEESKKELEVLNKNESLSEIFERNLRGLLLVLEFFK